MRMSMVVVVVVLAVASACGDDGQPPVDVAKPTVAVRTTDAGEVLVDDRGRTLYSFTGDSAGASACEGSCAELWPPLLTSRDPSAAAGVEQSKLGTITRSTGERQVTYEGKPLYRYQADAAPGDTKGQGVGNAWFVVKVAPSSASNTTTTGRGYDY